MAEIFITQSEADLLLAMDKYRENDSRWNFPVGGGYQNIPLFSNDKREKFLLDIGRTGFNLKKIKYQTRARNAVILARIDIGAPHKNPDGEEIGSPHIHIYKEGYADTYAYPLSKYGFTFSDDVYDLLNQFMKFCHIVKPPIIEEGLF